MVDSRNELIDMLRVWVKTLESLKPDQYDKLLSGKGKLVFQEIKVTQGIIFDESQMQNYIEEIMKFETREDAVQFLSHHKLNKKQLNVICNMLQIYTLKGDTKDQLIEKIVEGAVGAKLRSAAIKQTNLKGVSNSGEDVVLE